MNPAYRPLACAALIFAVPLTAQTTFYVSPAGNDAWSGSIAVPNATGTDGPFASPVQARDTIRAARAQGITNSFRVELRTGTYVLTEPLVFSPEDSGSEETPVVWRGYEQEKPVLSGGRLIEGLTESRADGLRRWTTRIDEVAAGKWYFRQLFISSKGGAYQRRYRPHLGMHAVAGLTYSPRRKAARHRAAQKDFIFFPGDICAWKNLSDVEVVALHMWSSSRLFIDRVDTEKNIVEFTGMPTFAIDQVGAHAPYYVENVQEALSEPGQWYLDRGTGVLTYLPLDGEELRDARLVAPFLSRVVVLEGDCDAGRFVNHLEFRGLTFSHNESELPPQGYGGSQAQPDLPAAIEAVGARNCAFVRCTVAQTGNYGIGLGIGCHDNRIEGCRLYDLGGGGIKVGDIRMKPTAEAPIVPTGNRITDCTLSDGGLMYYSANAIWAGIVRGTVISHNEIWNFPYSGIAVGWCWNDKPTSCAENRIEYNRIHHVVALLADGASIYTLGRQPGTVIRGNVLYDNEKNSFARQYWQLGLYLDEGSSEMLVENNLSYRVGTHGFNMNGGAENLIRNNIFGPVYGSHAPYIRCYARSFTKANVFTQNISYCDSDNLADAVWDRSLFDCKQNLYWNVAGKPLMFKGLSFSEWQATGQDQGSLNQDPLFENPENGDFRLKAGSPAFALGFEPFDTSVAGPRAEYCDPTTPVQVTLPPVYAMKAPGLPEPEPGFKVDCEDVPVGVVPREFRASMKPDEGADVQVTEEIAEQGRRCLKLTDRHGLSKTFYPYLNHPLVKPVTSGTVTFSFDFLQKPGSACALAVEFRDYVSQSGKKEFVTGPGLRIDPEGTVKAGERNLAVVPPGSWTHLAISFHPGNADAGADLTVTGPNGEPVRTTLPMDREFLAASHLYLIGDGDVDGSCYLDNLVLDVQP